MELSGGLRVTQGEIRKGQPFRVCVHGMGDNGESLYTNDKDEAALFALCVARRIVKGGR